MGICTYCGSTIETQDEHVIAQSKGGVATIPACRVCNQSKGDKPLMDWLRWVKRNDSYRWNRIKDFNYGKKNDIAIKVQTVRDE
jgi:5-methylcytosine-specific restriction endonuclease McrA